MDWRVFGVVFAVVLLFVALGWLGPSAFLVLAAPNPATAFGGVAALSCIDTKECREAIFPILEGYAVKPKSQKIAAYICTDPAITLTVRNPLALSDIKVMVNRQDIGEVEAGLTKSITFRIQGRTPSEVSKNTITETRKMGVDAEYVRGKLPLIDQGAKMGETIEVDFTWLPSQEQNTAFDTTYALAREIDSCKGRASQANNSTNNTFIDEASASLNQAAASFKNCDFSTANNTSGQAYDTLKAKCDAAYPDKGFQIPDNALEILVGGFVGALIIGWIWDRVNNSGMSY